MAKGVQKYPMLFQEGYLGKVRIPNRIAMLGMGSVFPGEDRMGENDVAYYGARAKGGAGLVIVGAHMVSERDFDPYPMLSASPPITSETQISRLAEVVDTIHGFGSVAGIMLSPGLGQNTIDLVPDIPPLSASPVPCKLDPNVLTREMTKEDINKKVSDMARAAGICAKAGFKVIEIHCHSGYLAEQFLDASTNWRTDEYGGSPEKRFRFIREIIQAMREKIGPNVALGIRYSANHFKEGKLTVKDVTQNAIWAEEAGVDFVDLDAGSYAARQWVCPSEYVDVGLLESFAAEIKTHLNVPVLHGGGYKFAEDCEAALEKGALDIVGLGRTLIADPEWPRKVKSGREDEIRTCVSCLNCLMRVYDAKHEDCTVNPFAFRETRFHGALAKTDFPKKVAVIGGGPSGMVTAITAKKRGHDVTILEKTDQLGGQLNLAGVEPFKRGVRGYLSYLKRQVELYDIPVKFGFDATVENVKELEPDTVVITTGADVYMPDFIPGNDKKDVVTIRGLYDMDLSEKKNIVIIGAGLVGCESALGLAREGHKVEIVEVLSEKEFLTKNFPYKYFNCIYLGLMQELEASNVKIHTSTKVKMIEDDYVVCEREDGSEFNIDRDVVLVSIGTKTIKPSSTVEEFEAEFDEVLLAGDTLVPGTIKNAAHTGFYTGLKI